MNAFYMRGILFEDIVNNIKSSKSQVPRLQSQELSMWYDNSDDSLSVIILLLLFDTIYFLQTN